MSLRFFVRGLLFSVVLAASLGPATQPAHADAVVGDGTPDSCDYNAFATAFAAGGYITFNCGPNPHTIVLEADGGLETTPLQHYTVDGGGLITLSAANVSGRRLFYVNSSYLTLTHISLVNAIMDGNGGAIFSFNSRVILDDVTIDHTGVPGAGMGGAIFNFGWLEIYDSTFEHNYANQGGAIYNEAGARVWINGSTFFSNTVGNGAYGGAIANSGVMTITGSTFTSNVQTLPAGTCTGPYGGICGGGAIANLTDARLVIRTSNFSGNLSSHDYGGGVLNFGDFSVQETSFIGNRALIGGGLASYYAQQTVVADTIFDANTATIGGGVTIRFGATAALNRTTFTRNSATNGDGGGLDVFTGYVSVNDSTFHANSASEGGGGIDLTYGGPSTVTNSTLSDNLAGYYGGGVLVLRTTGILRYVTLAGNEAGGIHVLEHVESHHNLYNVLLAGNTPANCSGQDPDSTGFNLSTDGTCFAAINGNQINAPQTLGPLADNGGPTLTHMIPAGSPAHNHGQCIDGLDYDQRGEDRSIGDTCDIGAVERQASDSGWYVFLPFTQR
jgi:hypothetical protein